MSNPTMISTLKRKVCFAYICSSCGFPVISIVQMTAEARKRYMFSATKAKEITNASAEEAMDIAISHINECRNTKGLVKTYFPMSPGESDNRYVRLNANGAGSFDICPEAYAICPNCFNFEPWMDSRLEDKVALYMASKLADECFPTVYLEGKDAERWARELVTQKMAAIENERKDENIVEQAKKDYYQTKPSVDDLKNRIQSIPGYKELEAVRNQIDSLKAQQKTIGTFNFKAKKEIRDSLAELTTQEAILSESVDECKAPLDVELYEQQKVLERNQLLAFGCNPEIIIKRFFTTFCYRHIPNDPPQVSVVTPQIRENTTTEIDRYDSRVIDNENMRKTRKPVFCHKCGSKLLSDSAFCSFCGAKLE